jgi:DNA repair exonuclease SbcCD ATPase subunit
MAGSLVALFVGLVAGGVGVLGGMSVVPLAVGVILLVVGVVLFFVARRERNKLNDVRMQNELREAEIARRLSGRTQLAEKVRQTDQERSEALASLGTKDLGAAERLLNAEADHIAQSDNRRAEYRGLMGKDAAPEAGSEDLATQRDMAAAEIDECKHALAGMGTIGQDPSGQLATFNAALQRLGPERDQARQDEANADARVTNNPVDAEKVAASSESLEQAQEQLAAAERRLRIYEDVLTTLNAAEQGTMKKAARFLEKRMANDVEEITDGRYRRLKVDEQSLTFSVFAPELNNWIDVNRLSQGTLDQLYLCARLGLVRQVTEPGTPPLIFDDPFVTFDADRAERALGVLKALGSDFQVILITSSDRYDAAADNVVVLPGPTARDEAAMVDAPDTGEAISMWTPSTLPSEAAPAASDNTSTGGRPATSKPAPPVSPLWPPEDH